MPYKQGPLKGQLKLDEIKRLAKARGLKYNFTQMAREDLIKRLAKDGYSVDHQGARLVRKTPQRPQRSPPQDLQKQLEARKQDMIRRGLRGPQGQLGTGVGGRWTLQDEIENLTR